VDSAHVTCWFDKDDDDDVTTEVAEVLKIELAAKAQ
jgi:hypothetical protein